MTSHQIVGRVSLMVVLMWGVGGCDNPAQMAGLPGHTVAASAQIPAFPGAEGFGMWSRGGRGGRVFVVTTLEDYKLGEKAIPGSLRQAVEAVGPRIVLFNVSGCIDLKERLNILSPYITVAGQTAPGEGIALTGRGINIDTSEVIVRYLRIRLGSDRQKIVQDCVNIGGRSARNVILDHISTSWSSDEGISTNKVADNVTVQNCIMAENLGAHAFGGIIGSYKGNITYCNNLYISNRARNPRVAGWARPANGIWPGRENILDKLGTVSVEFRNNVVYNWGRATGENGNYKSNYADPDPDYTIEQTALIGNYYCPGPNSELEVGIMKCRVPNSKLYLDGNLWDGRHVGWEKVVYGKAVSELRAPTMSDVRVDSLPFKVNPHHEMKAQEACEYVLTSAGYSLRRDDVDKRLVREVRERKGALVPNSSSIPPWKGPKQSRPWVDSSGDGIPDWWHAKYAMDPQKWLDPAGDLDGDGYTNIEEYLNGTDPRKFVDYTDLVNNVSTWPAAQATASHREPKGYPSE